MEKTKIGLRISSPGVASVCLDSRNKIFFWFWGLYRHDEYLILHSLFLFESSTRIVWLCEEVKTLTLWIDYDPHFYYTMEVLEPLLFNRKESQDLPPTGTSRSKRTLLLVYEVTGQLPNEL